MFDFLFKNKNTLEDEMREYQKESSNVSLNIGSYNSMFKVEDVFTITGRGTVVTGKVEKGILKIGDSVNVTDKNGVHKYVCTITGIECFRKLLNSCSEGDSVGLLLKDVQRNQIASGYILSK